MLPRLFSLPETFLGGAPAAGAGEEQEEEVDWKDIAYQRQLERIQARKRKAQPNYKAGLGIRVQQPDFTVQFHVRSLVLAFNRRLCSQQETAEERKVRLRKLAMWNAAQRKGMSGVFGQDESTVDIKALGV